MRCEHQIAITDQGIWKAVNPDDMLDEQGSHVKRRHGFCRGYENRLFCKSVDHHEDCVVIVAGRQVRNPVQGHTALQFSWDRKSVRTILVYILTLDYPAI